MRRALTPTRSALGGTAVVMSCACGASRGSAQLIASAGIGGITHLVHPLFLGVGAASIIAGLWRLARTSAYLAVAAFGVLAVAATLTPARARPRRPWRRLCGPWVSSSLVRSR